jgi:hypothetical protein
MMRNGAFKTLTDITKIKAVGGLAATTIALTGMFGAGKATAQEPTTTAAPAAVVAQAATPVAAEQNPTPVAGLDQTQMDNAKKIVDTAKAMGLNERAQTIAIATAMQESNLHNLASTKLPESYEYTDEGEGSDHDSVGLFQQRQNWGKTKDLMTPETSARKFLEALQDVPGWERMPLSVAAQKVQVSAYPDAYAKHETRATQIVDALNK